MKTRSWVPSPGWVMRASSPAVGAPGMSIRQIQAETVSSSCSCLLPQADTWELASLLFFRFISQAQWSSADHWAYSLLYWTLAARTTSPQTSTFQPFWSLTALACSHYLDNQVIIVGLIHDVFPGVSPDGCSSHWSCPRVQLHRSSPCVQRDPFPYDLEPLNYTVPSTWTRLLGSSDGKESTCNAGNLDSIPGLGRSPGEENGYPLQYSGLENPMDCTAHGAAKSRTRLSNFPFTTWAALPFPVQPSTSPPPSSCKVNISYSGNLCLLPSCQGPSLPSLHPLSPVSIPDTTSQNVTALTCLHLLIVFVKSLRMRAVIFSHSHPCSARPLFPFLKLGLCCPKWIYPKCFVHHWASINGTSSIHFYLLIVTHDMIDTCKPAIQPET